MADAEGIMALTSFHMAQLRLSGLLYATMIGKGLLTPLQAAALVRDAGDLLPKMAGPAHLLQQMRDAYDALAKDLGEHPGP